MNSAIDYSLAYVNSTSDSIYLEIILLNASEAISGAYQTIYLNRTSVLPFRLRGYSKSEYIVPPVNTYAVVVKFSYFDGTSDFISINFTGSVNFTMQETTFTPPQPVYFVNVSCEFGHTAGTAFFDNIALQEQIPGIFSRLIGISNIGFRCQQCVSMLRSFII